MGQKVFFENSTGVKLCGILSDPGVNKESPVIILCHGFTSSKDSPTYQSMEKRLNKHKLATFRFDFFGHGESGGDFADITVSEGVDDILSAIAFLKLRGYKTFGLLGSSYGGMCCLMAASKSKEVAVLALRSPVSDFAAQQRFVRTAQELKEWKEKGYTYYHTWYGRKLKLHYTFFEDFRNNDGYEAAKKITVPTIIIHGTADDRVPLEQSKKTARLIKNCVLEIIEGADHRYSNSGHFEKGLRLLTAFIAGHAQGH